MNGNPETRTVARNRPELIAKISDAQHHVPDILAGELPQLVGQKRLAIHEHCGLRGIFSEAPEPRGEAAAQNRHRS
jgi:hypothetical protein